MALESDITVNVAKFDPKNVSEKTIKFSEELLKVDKAGPNWWEVCPFQFLHKYLTRMLYI
jgi:hypothetical protein